MRCLEVSSLWGPWEVASNITAAGSAKAVRWGKDGCLIYPGNWFYKTKSALKRKKEKRSLHILNSHEET